MRGSATQPVSHVCYWHLTDKPPAPEFVAYWTNNGQKAALGLDLSAAIDPTATSASISCCSGETSPSPLSKHSFEPLRCRLLSLRTNMRRREFSGCAELCSGCVANPTDVYVDALLRNDAAPAPSPQASAGNLFATRAELGRLMASGTRSPSTASVLWKRRSPASLPGFLSSTAG